MKSDEGLKVGNINYQFILFHLFTAVTFTSVIIVVVVAVGVVVVAIAAVVVVAIAAVVVAQFSIPTGYRIKKTDGQDLRRDIIYVITSV